MTRPAPLTLLAVSTFLLLQATVCRAQGDLLTEADLVYRGAFAFPDSEPWAYSGHALAYRRDGDPAGGADGFPGSLFAAGHRQQDLVGELSIPSPVVTDSFDELPRAVELQPLQDVTDGLLAAACAACPSCECDTWDVDGLEVLPDLGRLAWNLRDWYNAGAEDVPSLGWSRLDLDGAEGVWHVGPRPNDLYPQVFHNAKTCNYLLKAPAGFADQHLGGRWLIAGNHRLSGALGGSQGPTLYATAPWDDGDPPAAGQDLDAVALLFYPWVLACTENQFDQCHLPGYRVDDRWGGAAWVDTGGKRGVLVFGLKGLGDNCYGVPDPSDPIEPCPTSLCFQDKGWHSDPYEPQILFYDPGQLAEVAAGNREPWQVLPYRVWRPTAEVFGPDCALLDAVAYDPERRLVYVTESLAGPWGETAVHVWEVLPGGGPTCSLTCEASVAATAAVGEAVSFEGRATATGCSGAPAFAWDFGDGATSGEEDSTHAYAAAGVYGWSLTVTVGDRTCTRSGTVAVGGAGAAYQLLVPAVIHAPGAAGTRWRTALACLNPTDAAVDLDLTLVVPGGRTLRSLTLGGGASVEWQDVVVDLFERPATEDAAGAVHLAADGTVLATSRTYNQAPEGTYGQYLPALSASSCLGEGGSGFLLQLKGNDDFRTNVGFANLSAAEGRVRVRLHDASGAAVGDPVEVVVPAGAWAQVNDVFAVAHAGPRDLAWATVEALEGDAVWAYASVVDNRTGDAATIPVLRE